MGLTRTAPWWLTWALVGSLGLLYLGERVFTAFGGVSLAFSLIGAVGVLVVTLVRAMAWKGASGDVRKVEGILFLGTLGCLLGLVIWFVSSPSGMDLLGIGFATAAEENRFRVTAQIIWVLALSASLLSLIGAQIALGAHRHARGAVAGVESYRVTDAASAGLSVALVLATLFVVGYIVSAKDKVLDMSYFRTSVPGTSTEAMVSEMFTPLNVHLFFPETNEVKEEALRYFRRLQETTGNVQIESHDRLVARALAQEFMVGVDGTVVLQAGDRLDRIVLPTDLRQARRVLRSFDVSVQGSLLTLVQGNRTVYLTVGHGELNAPRSAGGLGAAPADGGFQGGSIVRGDETLPEWMRAEDPIGGTTVFQEILGILNYDVRDIGIQNGLGLDIPENAAMVAILGPRMPFLPEEISAIERYLDRGGSLLIAMEPNSSFVLGPLEARMGARFVNTPLAIDVPGLFLQQRGSLSDRQLLITNQFYSHPATTSILQDQTNLGMVFVESGYLEETGGAGDSNRRILIEALGNTFADLDGDFEYDEGTEERFRFALALAAWGAVEPSVAEGEAGGLEVDADGNGADSTASSEWRALLVADSEVFSDPVLANVVLNRAFLADGARWLGRDEAFAGTTETEEDVPIVHTRSEHVAWFYSIILGAPALVLIGGLLGVFLRRRHRGEI